VVVVPRTEAAEILKKAQRLLKTEHLLQEKIKAGATIGELVNIDAQIVFIQNPVPRPFLEFWTELTRYVRAL
jgi:hypothetical protein